MKKNKTNYPALYKAWDNMKQRVKKNKNYISRNIKYCNQWEIFEGFFNDMYSTYKDGLTLDRIDNNGDYEPLSKGGEHLIENIVLACPHCNMSKHDKDPLEFANKLGRLL